MKNIATSIKVLAGAATIAAVALLYPPGLQAAPETLVTPKHGLGQNERHPRIRAAIRELHAAMHEMKEANHDFGGHREAAMTAAETAIDQLQKALEHDKK